MKLEPARNQVVLGALIAACAALWGCGGDPKVSTRGRRLEAPIADQHVVEVAADEGDVVLLVGPSVPLHPGFRDSRTEADYDPAKLSLLEVQPDPGRWGSMAERFAFQVVSEGETEVRLLLRGRDGMEKTYHYRIQCNGAGN